jgi:hypothetical protein
MAFRGLVLTAAVFLGLPEVVDAGVTAANRAVIVEVEEDDVTIKSHGDGFTIFAGDKQMVHIKVTPQPGWKITTPPATELTPPGSTNYAAEGAREMTAAGRISAVPGHGTGHEEDNP